MVVWKESTPLMWFQLRCCLVWIPLAFEDSCNGEQGLGSNKFYLISYVVLFLLEHSQNDFYVYAHKHKPLFMCINLKIVFASGPKINFVSLHKHGSWLPILWREQGGSSQHTNQPKREGQKPGGFMNPWVNLEENSYYNFDDNKNLLQVKQLNYVFAIAPRSYLTSWSEHPLINSHIALFWSNCLFIAVLDRSQLTCQFCHFRFFVTPIFH